jgi:aspartyl-tRNA(Asn)/glutamyl-tRNA(Gln) amidotransferase subunit C
MKSDQVRHIATLARIGVEEHELADYAQHLSDLIHLIDQINAVDTKDVEPLYHPLESHLDLRDDEVTSKNAREVLMKNAPAAEDGLFLVPKVIEEA